MSKIGKLLKKIVSWLKSFSDDIDEMNREKNLPPWSKERSYALVVAADYRRDTCPVNSVEAMRGLFADAAAEVDVVVDADATGDRFLELLRKGISYETFFFYETAHGNSRSIRLIDRHVKAQEIWDALKDAENRIVGFFDSCCSGSVIETDAFSAFSGPGSMAGFLADEFRREGARLASRGKKRPDVKLYSACADGVFTTYQPESYTEFQAALSKAYRKTKDLTYADFDERLVEFGTYGPKDRPQYRVVPQTASYGRDFSSLPPLR